MDVVTLAAELLAIPSQTKAEGRAVEFVSRWLVAGVGASRAGGLAGARQRLATRGKGAVTLSTHLDTVPPFNPPAPRGRAAVRPRCVRRQGHRRRDDGGAENSRPRARSGWTCCSSSGRRRARRGAARQPAAGHLALLLNGSPPESRLATGTRLAARHGEDPRARGRHSAYSHLGKSAILPRSRCSPSSRRWRAERSAARRHDDQRRAHQGGRGQHRARPCENRADGARDRASPRRSKQALENGRRAGPSWSGADTRRCAPQDRSPASRPGRWPTRRRAVPRALGDAVAVGPGSIHVAHTPTSRGRGRAQGERGRLREPNASLLSS